MSFYPFKEGWGGASSEEVSRLLKEGCVFDAYPSYVLPFFQVFC